MPLSRHLQTIVLLAVLLFFTGVGRSSAQMTTEFGGTGLTSLKYGGFEFITDPFVYSSIILKNSAGTRYEVGSTSRTFDQALKVLTITYPWGSITVHYTVEANRLNMRVVMTNNGNDPIVESALGLLRVRFPQVPAGGGWAEGFEMADVNIDEITAVPADFGTGLLVVCNDVPGSPLKFGYTSPDGASTRAIRMTTFVTDSADDVRIAPHTSTQFRFSLRFAAGGTSPETLIPDLHAALRAITPPVLAWADRRAIGTVFLSSNFHISATNPRGWLNEPTLNTVTPAGLTDFRQQMLARADDIVLRLKDMNAQGMIFWDVEGEQYPYITYAGDPRVIGSLAPEMDGIANEFFAKFTAAGLRTGVCLRPSRIVPGFPGNGHVWDHDNYGFDVLANLSDKITYAKNRWGCTLFYIDSNVDWAFNDSGQFLPRLLRSSIYTSLHALHPDVLVIPEIPRTADWAGSAPYREINTGGFSYTRARSKAVYPEALTIIEPKDTDWAANHALLVDAVRSGDILLFRSWFPDSGNPFIKAIYQEAHPAPAITSAATASGDTGAVFNYAILASNQPTAYSATGLPSGLTVDASTGAITGTPLVAGTFTATLRASSLWGTGEKPLVITLRSQLDQWRALFFPGQGSSGQAASSANFDGDIYTNLFEFALGLNPTAFDLPNKLPRVERVTDGGLAYPAITFRRRKTNPLGVNYLVEESLNLTNWSLVDSTTYRVGPPVDQGDGTELVTVRGTHPLNPGQSFLRLRVTEQ